MTNPGYETISQYRDVESIHYYEILLEEGMMCVKLQKMMLGAEAFSPSYDTEMAGENRSPAIFNMPYRKLISWITGLPASCADNPVILLLLECRDFLCRKLENQNGVAGVGNTVTVYIRACRLLRGQGAKLCRAAEHLRAVACGDLAVAVHIAQETCVRDFQ